MKTLDEYLQLPYTIELTPDRDEEGNGGFVAQVRELPGCLSQGTTAEDAVTGVRDAMAGWISVALEDGVEVPEPRGEDAYSGRLLLRMPRGLHAELARQAEEEGASLNQYIATLLAGAAHWRARDLVH